MKSLPCMMLLVISAVGQTAQPQVAPHQATLAELARSITPTGTLPTTNKKISELKVSDLPDAARNPLSMETSFKCMTLAELALANDEQRGAIAELVPQDVLESTPKAVYGCLVLDLQSMPNDKFERVAAQIGALTGATAEITRRDVNHLIEQYNALLAVAKNLQSQLLAVQMQNAQQQRINNSLMLYQMMPKYKPPQIINLQVSDCTRLPALCIH